MALTTRAVRAKKQELAFLDKQIADMQRKTLAQVEAMNAATQVLRDSRKEIVTELANHGVEVEDESHD